MVEVTLSDISLGGKGKGLGVCKFAVLPRTGDLVVLSVEDRAKATYEVVNIMHMIYDRSKPAGIWVSVREEGSDRAFRSEDIDKMFRSAQD
jgi:hypothetical protein